MGRIEYIEEQRAFSEHIKELLAKDELTEEEEREIEEWEDEMMRSQFTIVGGF